MRFPEPLSADRFLAGYWQKRPLFMPGALEHLVPALGPDEIAWLATLPDVESRLVFRDREHDGYRLEHGPFDEAELTRLPDRDWTLLVQDVDKHLPVMRDWFSVVGFVPDWRIDDLMISVAAPGGSVGPHSDNYDVFLCQTDGRREWRVAAADAGLARVEHGELSLLEPFEVDNALVSRPGDVLYLPPGVPHWGIAIDLCVTLSIGMRAPEWADFERLAGAAPTSAAERRFYSDPDLEPGEARPGRISGAALRRARSFYEPAADLDERRFAELFGRIVTEPKPWLTPERPGEDEVLDLPHQDDSGLRVHGMARIAYCEPGDDAIVFSNGSCLSVTPQQLNLILGMFSERRLTGAVVRELRSESGNAAVLEWLIGTGGLDCQPQDGR